MRKSRKSLSVMRIFKILYFYASEYSEITTPRTTFEGHPPIFTRPQFNSVNADTTDNEKGSYVQAPLEAAN